MGTGRGLLSGWGVVLIFFFFSQKIANIICKMKPEIVWNGTYCAKSLIRPTSLVSKLCAELINISRMSTEHLIVISTFFHAQMAPVLTITSLLVHVDHFFSSALPPPPKKTCDNKIW